jgi:hypothetical protein
VHRDAWESSLVGQTFLPLGPVPRGGVGFSRLSLRITGPLGRSGKFIRGLGISAPGSMPLSRGRALSPKS